MQKYFTSIIILFALFTTGCASMPFLYKPPIQQGNVVTPDMVARLKTGMTPDQVRYVLGEPILNPALNHQRWEYVYTYLPNRGKMERRLVTVYFQNGVMEKVTTEGLK
jgi:outer membrane protein assembly factor BamE